MGVRQFDLNFGFTGIVGICSLLIMKWKSYYKDVGAMLSFLYLLLRVLVFAAYLLPLHIFF